MLRLVSGDNLVLKSTFGHLDEALTDDPSVLLDLGSLGKLEAAFSLTLRSVSFCLAGNEDMVLDRVVVGENPYVSEYSDLENISIPIGDFQGMDTEVTILFVLMAKAAKA